MEKILTFLLLVMLLSIVQVPTAQAWTGKTHSDVVEQVYYSLPGDVQQKLSLSEMRNGSDDPDLKFFDYSYHRYPASYNKAIYWLDEGEAAYKKGDYRQASYCFGVASHYISDSFAAAHCVKGYTGYHTLYELQAVLLNPHIIFTSGNLKSLLKNGRLSGEYSWNRWMITRSDSYVQNDLDQATSASYVAILGRVN
ncbi:MAG: zinc dependent phospholipase C family protein [Methanobacteriaceae archaeon]|nr:zinc dependent phospholipase C family protein [Methanobacteriaceae archaeon]